mmetsp:Transcript_68623/g.192346  ORF Transcript_68623/g.192346 Transcript_68623/m.192346 type:complete len:434 (-) Transcript_68623:360-1661(-)
MAASSASRPSSRLSISFACSAARPSTLWAASWNVVSQAPSVKSAKRQRMLRRGAALPARWHAGQTPSSPTRLLHSNEVPARGSWHAMYISGCVSPCFLVCTVESREMTEKTSGCAVTSSAAARMSAMVQARSAARRAAAPPAPSCESAVRLWEEPPVNHHNLTFSASGVVGEKIREPASSKEPLRPPFHSLTRTPRSSTTTPPSNKASSCCARSPHKVTCMLRPEWSAMTISRFTKAFPACEVKENGALELTTTPQSSAVQGNGFACNAKRSVTPSCDNDNDVNDAWPPEAFHHCRTRSASGNVESKTMEPACSKEPVRPPLNSLTVTPFKHTSGLPSKSLSSIFARSPQMAMSMLVVVSSATVISRLTSALPSLDVNSTNGLNATIMPQRSTLHGIVFDCTTRRSTKLNFTAAMLPSSVAGSTRPSRSNTSS